MQMLAQGIEQGGARIERQPMLCAVDSQRHLDSGWGLIRNLRRCRRRTFGKEWCKGKNATGYSSKPKQLAPCHIEIGHKYALCSAFNLEAGLAGMPTMNLCKAHGVSCSTGRGAVPVQRGAEQPVARRFSNCTSPSATTPN